MNSFTDHRADIDIIAALTGIFFMIAFITIMPVQVSIASHSKFPYGTSTKEMN
jgi:hypothetical protein